MSRQQVKVKRETLEACTTCPLCHKLFKDATTMSLCLRNFCRKCIYEKLSDDETDSCPVCNIDLGCVPVDRRTRECATEVARKAINSLEGARVFAVELFLAKDGQILLNEVAPSALTDFLTGRG
ncbi:hypothetical protein L6164_010591 [Bauhinia variegata]|uniref:Uncharacterized protein n=1 Tax=Bauhinia variegata TaxID=167791 RepID=A0ACB9PNM1_BAUVA|nr:hypothetical protein L6164_010591 [Bauhinia variegata]